VLASKKAKAMMRRVMMQLRENRLREKKLKDKEKWLSKNNKNKNKS
jgi:hypothetical protein